MTLGPEQGGGPRPSVLVIEDEEIIGLDLCDLLDGAGYEVVGPVGTLAAGLDLLRRTMPSAAIVDLQLRDGPGLELLNELRARDIPFVIHSGRIIDERDLAWLQDAPCLSKPVAPDRMIDLLGRLLAGT